MSDQVELNAEGRSDVGKGASRRLRRLSGRVPGIVYGGGNAAVPITLQENELAKAMQSESFFSQILNVKIDGGDQQAVVRDVQRHPATERVMHIDFLRIRADRVIQVSVPIHFLNEDSCVGVKMGGGSIQHSMNEVEVSCLPAALPEFVELDMAEVEVGGIVHISDIQLPEGVTSTAWRWEKITICRLLLSRHRALAVMKKTPSMRKLRMMRTVQTTQAMSRPARTNPLKLIAGLGNPGSAYAATRHNVGSGWVERLAREHGISLRDDAKFHGLLGRGEIAGVDVRLLLPQTYMNLSGDSVAAAVKFFKIEPAELLVVHDELAFEPGQVRLKTGGGINGHNGLRDIIPKLGNRDGFHRLRVGVGHPGSPDKVASYLTSARVPDAEREKIDGALKLAPSVLKALLHGDMPRAMNAINARPARPQKNAKNKDSNKQDPNTQDSNEEGNT